MGRFPQFLFVLEARRQQRSESPARAAGGLLGDGLWRRRSATIDVTKPLKIMGFGAIAVTRPYRFIGFGATDVTKPYKFVGFATYRLVTHFYFFIVGPDQKMVTKWP